MAGPDTLKLVPRNVAALRRGQTPAEGARLLSGNPVATRLESAVGNCFPGLECDLRNLERRFFPFLEVDIADTEITIVSVDSARAEEAAVAGTIAPALRDIYRTIRADLAQQTSWQISRVSGTFGPLGTLSLVVADLAPPSIGAGRAPPDAWTAIRLLTEDSEVTLEVHARGSRVRRQLTGRRARYLDDNGALAAIFLPGELTQSLCSPWTHDFRDCGCYYWASNHPDIALPPLPQPAPNDPQWNAPVPWERSDRVPGELPARATTQPPDELDHYEINLRWQELNFVLDGRELVEPYVAGQVVGTAFDTPAELAQSLRYAAGVELAVIQEYLCAAYSLRPSGGLAPVLRDDVAAARAELMRVTIGEMHHLRAVNGVLRSFLGVAPFVPALQVAAAVPSQDPGGSRALSFRPLLPEVLDDFIAIEQPSVSVDGLYARILASLENLGTDEQRQSIRTIMAEGEDHYQTFLFIRQWLGAHPREAYLLGPNLVAPPPGNELHQTLQRKYREVLERLYQGYALGVPAGAPPINAAREAMLGSSGIVGAAAAVAQAGFLVTFETIAGDPRFAPIAKP